MEQTAQAPHSASWLPVSEEDRDLVRRQLNRLLETHYFRNSRRYPALFRFLVEETLAGRGELLKERLLGVEVFDRPADYDTAADPIVRVTIAEIRKRIAQYYHEDAHESELRIEMSPGRYEPEFRLRNDAAVAEPASGASASSDLLAPHGDALPSPTSLPALDSLMARPGEPSNVGHRRVPRRWIVAGLLAGGAAGLLLLGGLLFWPARPQAAMEEFWQPLLATKAPVIFCLPIPEVKSAASNVATSTPSPSMTTSGRLPNASFLEHETLGENVVYSDVLATLSLTNLLAARGRTSKLRLSPATTLDDLRGGPAVLIGGLDNPWTLRSVAGMRYRFEDRGKERFQIVDARNGGRQDWGLDLTLDYATVTHDYAIIARHHNSATGQLEVIVAGIGMSGTAAAGEFLSSPEQMQALRSAVGKGFASRDFEAVLGTDVVNGRAGPPRILAVEVQ